MTAAATMNGSSLLEVLQVYFDAFAERDPNRRRDLLVRCLTPECAIWGHRHVFAGYSAISQKIARFQADFPECRLVLASGVMTFDNIARSGIAIVREDGSVVARGESVSEVATDGRLCRIVPLWETELPPIPESWPARLAADLEARPKTSAMPPTASEREQLRLLEESMWRPETRFARDRMERLLAADFVEYGRSGRIHSRVDVLSTAHEHFEAELPLGDFNVRLLAPDVAQSTYTSRVKYGDRWFYSRRSSIWSRHSGSWMLRFHQGTPCDGDA